MNEKLSDQNIDDLINAFQKNLKSLEKFVNTIHNYNQNKVTRDMNDLIALVQSTYSAFRHHVHKVF